MIYLEVLIIGKLDLKERESFGLEKTYLNDLKTIDELKIELEQLYNELVFKLRDELRNSVSIVL